MRHEDNVDTASDTSTEECVHLIDNDTVQHKIRIEFADYGGSEYADVLSQSEATDNALAEEVAVAMRLRLPEIGIQPHTQPTTPSSDHTTIPLDGFLDVQRMSFGSGPNSDLAAVIREEDSEASNEVFSPPTYVTCS
ncbi:uncharacterized protein LOC128920085 [Zeugodacus cucurbitae]|uniref:uncharacterized protein LOC128920085 n=1 Tax=Zeugodacus cucurbitae TaxID=28588 RepID=UPI0023D903FF|nr:uncharacterized protein LOC128920085 [Zeugodacus cucurbitae]